GNQATDSRKECKNVEGIDQIICVHAFISGCTIEGRNYAEDVSCPDVRMQGRPFRPIKAPLEPSPSDPRLQDPVFMEELAWTKNQVRSCGCACCHDTSVMKDFALWDINKPHVWIEQMTRRGVVILSGQLSSTSLGSVDPADNNGFDRSQTGAPTTDPARFKAFFKAEADRRGITAEEIAKMRPLNIPGPVGRSDAEGVEALAPASSRADR
ncbi:hypothetical protein DAPPUDRAFT_126054, partial [Daphnia pulex]